jgi:hypothetical protein
MSVAPSPPPPKAYFSSKLWFTMTNVYIYVSYIKIIYCLKFFTVDIICWFFFQENARSYEIILSTTYYFIHDFLINPNNNTCIQTEHSTDTLNLHSGSTQFKFQLYRMNFLPPGKCWEPFSSDIPLYSSYHIPFDEI